MSQNNFLYEEYNFLTHRIPKKIPDYVINNLNQKFALRGYQIEAFARFLDYLTEYHNPVKPTHLSFNMATGSGKTLLMAGLILYLYEQGYRNFLFFVHTMNIIEKTRDNFLNHRSSKFLFNSKINFGGRVVEVQEIKNFEEADADNINICFTTIQKLHEDLHTEKENGLTFDDFEGKKIALLSDEAHHINATTKQNEKRRSWENTVEKILKKNKKENILLDFTATVDYSNKSIVEKYRSKVIYRYDLREFRNDGYSKDIDILQSDLDEQERMLQAIIISQYRQEVAGKNKINLKPVVLFKAQKEIKESKENQEKFNALIENLTVFDIRNVREHSNAELLRRAFLFFSENKITDSVLVQKLAQNFALSNCLNVNDKDLDKELPEQSDKQQLFSQQVILNSLEDNDNQYRAIFAVQKLNEGWDVLNLFDIVRLYNTRDMRGGKPGTTTVAEAQLIGRGARYFPFAYGTEDRYKRKFDNDSTHPLRILEEMHYHSVKNSKYIHELKMALKDKGFYDEDHDLFELSIKKEFKAKGLYNDGRVYLNEQVENKNEKVKSFNDLGVKVRNIECAIATGDGAEEAVFGEQELHLERQNGISKKIPLGSIRTYIIRKAMARNPFYNFDSIKKYFPHIRSAREFAESADYLGGLAITFYGLRKDESNLTNRHRLAALTKLLSEIALEVKANTVKYIGTSVFKPQEFSEIFVDKILKLRKKSERAKGQQEFLADKDWYVFNANYGTDEEKAFVETMETEIDSLREKHKRVYLVRNEQHFKIYNFKDGAGYAPDFVLFLEKKGGESIVYQIFIEPKGKHLKEYDQWKEDFMQSIEGEHSPITLGESKEYKIIGLPFYNSEEPNKFSEDLHSALEQNKKKGASNKRDKKAGVDSPS